MKLFPSRLDYTIPEGGISTLETVTLGGVEHSMLIQAENPNNPVLLFLHGGPGMPMPGVSCRGRDFTGAMSTKELVKHFVLVYYDQRGTGKSFSTRIDPASMRVEQFISDAEEMVHYLTQRFHQDKLYLAGHSWGTILGLALAARIPEKLFAYVGISQIVNWTKNDILCREWIIEEATRWGDSKAILELESVGLPPYTESMKQWGVLRKWMFKYKSMVYTSDDVKHPGFFTVFTSMLKSPDYTLMDIFNTFYRGVFRTFTQQMIEDFAKIDFVKSAPRVEIPVHFIHGRKDVHVFGSQVEKYLDILDAPRGKQLFWVDKSSHIFHPDDGKIIENYLINLIPPAK
jgi:pimeloyl-ACP methyl ester carboxylesterase